MAGRLNSQAGVLWVCIVVFQVDVLWIAIESVEPAAKKKDKERLSEVNLNYRKKKTSAQI